MDEDSLHLRYIRYFRQTLSIPKIYSFLNIFLNMFAYLYLTSFTIAKRIFLLFTENNAMLQAKPNALLKIRVLDFGRAKILDEKQTIVKDIQEIIRVFTSVYVTEKFQNATDLKKNWKEKLEVVSYYFFISKKVGQASKKDDLR